jgi:hypothetical protein
MQNGHAIGLIAGYAQEFAGLRKGFSPFNLDENPESITNQTFGL